MLINFTEISEDEPQWEEDINLPDDKSSDTPASNDDVESSYESPDIISIPPNSTPQQN